MAKDLKEEILEREIEVQEQRIEADEKKTKRAFIILIVLFFIIFASLVFIYMAFLNTKTSNTKVQSLPSPTTIPSPTISLQPTITISPSDSGSTNSNTIKDYFISFGSGTSSVDDWTDVGGLQASFDLGSYANIKEIRFEVSATVPTANEIVWVRLYNKTDNHPVWNTEVTLEGASDYAVSEPISYDKGNKTYQVQMKTQLKYPANITQSRLHIILK